VKRSLHKIERWRAIHSVHFTNLLSTNPGQMSSVVPLCSLADGFGTRPDTALSSGTTSSADGEDIGLLETPTSEGSKEATTHTGSSEVVAPKHKGLRSRRCIGGVLLSKGHNSALAPTKVAFAAGHEAWRAAATPAARSAVRKRVHGALAQTQVAGVAPARPLRASDLTLSSFRFPRPSPRSSVVARNAPDSSLPRHVFDLASLALCVPDPAPPALALAAADAHELAPGLVLARLDGAPDPARPAPSTLWLASAWGAWAARAFAHVVCVIEPECATSGSGKRAARRRVVEGIDAEGVRHLWLAPAALRGGRKSTRGPRLAMEQLARACAFVRQRGAAPRGGAAIAGASAPAVLLACAPGLAEADVLALAAALMVVTARGTEGAIDILTQLVEVRCGAEWKGALATLDWEDVELIDEAVRMSFVLY
jgi:hypothetical protein